MKDKINQKIHATGSISKNAITDKIKAEQSDRYDQMLVNGEIERNDVLYVNYRAKYINVSVQKLLFAMTEDVALDFQAKCTGGEGVHGPVSELDNSIIQLIRSSNAMIAEKSIGDVKDPDDLKKMPTLQYLSKGFADFNDVVSDEEGVSVDDDKSLFGSFKKLMNEPILGSSNDDDDDDDDDDEDFFGSVDWFGSSSDNLESSQNEYVKNRSLKNLTFEYNGDAPIKRQPLHFVPQLTKVDDCKVCRGDGEVDCPSCKGTGELDCPGEVVSRKDAAAGTNEHQKCSHGVLKGWKDTHNQAGWGDKVNYDSSRGYVHNKCRGTGKVVCSRSNNSRYGIGKLADLATGKQFCEGSKVIKCKPCKATGQIGTLVYIKTIVGEVSGEFFKYTNQKIDQIVKKPDLLFPYLNKGEVRPTTVYSDINGSLSDDYDNFSSGFIPEIENKAGLQKGDNYPRLIQEEVYYDVIPLATLEYNHILTATNHNVSAVAKGNDFDILFHSDPTAVKRFSLKNLFKSYFSKWPEAFMTKSYKAKRDKFNEIRMLIYVAKADGNIADEEKLVLSNAITGLTEYTATEKSKLFGLMSSKSLPELIDNDFVISTKERADVVFKRLDEMALEDSRLEKPEVVMVREFKEKINSNLGRYQGKFKHFLKTWQVSLTMFILIPLLVISNYWFLIIRPVQVAASEHQELLVEMKNIETYLAQPDTVFMDANFMDPFEVKEKIMELNHESNLMVQEEKKEITYNSFWKNKQKDLLAQVTVFIDNYKLKQELENTNEEVVQEELPEFTPDDSGAEVYPVIEKVYFYSKPIESAKLKSFFLAGQSGLLLGYAGDFTKVQFEYNGKVTIGYVLTNEVEIGGLGGDYYEEEPVEEEGYIEEQSEY